jgi:hypothetical protein
MEFTPEVGVILPPGTRVTEILQEILVLGQLQGMGD